jgi:hypothetical protein
LSGTVGIFPATYVEEVWTTNDDIIIFVLFSGLPLSICKNLIRSQFFSYFCYRDRIATKINADLFFFRFCQKWRNNEFITHVSYITFVHGFSTFICIQKLRGYSSSRGEFVNKEWP